MPGRGCWLISRGSAGWMPGSRRWRRPASASLGAWPGAGVLTRDLLQPTTRSRGGHAELTHEVPDRPASGQPRPASTSGKSGAVPGLPHLGVRHPSYRRNCPIADGTQLPDLVDRVAGPRSAFVAGPRCGRFPPPPSGRSRAGTRRPPDPAPRGCGLRPCRRRRTARDSRKQHRSRRRGRPAHRYAVEPWPVWERPRRRVGPPRRRQRPSSRA
jgi:hypothetical protein